MSEKLEWKLDKLRLYAISARMILEDEKYNFTDKQKIELALVWLNRIEEEK